VPALPRGLGRRGPHRRHEAAPGARGRRAEAGQGRERLPLRRQVRPLRGASYYRRPLPLRHVRGLGPVRDVLRPRPARAPRLRPEAPRRRRVAARAARAAAAAAAERPAAGVAARRGPGRRGPPAGGAHGAAVPRPRARRLRAPPRARYENGYVIENPINPVTEKPYTHDEKLALIVSINSDGPCVFHKAKSKQKRLQVFGKTKFVITHRVMALFRRAFYTKNKHLNPDAGTPDEQDPRVTWSLDASHLCGNGDGDCICIRLAHVVLESRHENNARIDCHSFGKTHCLTPIDPGWFALAGHRCAHNPPCV